MLLFFCVLLQLNASAASHSVLVNTHLLWRRKTLLRDLISATAPCSGTTPTAWEPLADPAGATWLTTLSSPWWPSGRTSTAAIRWSRRGPRALGATEVTSTRDPRDLTTNVRTIVLLVTPLVTVHFSVIPTWGHSMTNSKRAELLVLGLYWIIPT